MSKKTITIIIPAYNEEKTIASCINSCLIQTRKADQIIVVNDGSTDNTSQILELYEGFITVVTNEVATGNKSRAQEIGIEATTSEIFVATDGDTILDPHFLKQIEKDFIDDPKTAAVAGYIKSTKHNYLTSARELDYVVGQDLYKYAQSCINFIVIIPGCAGAFRTSLFRDGTINLEHDTLTEDLDFTYKIHAAGLPIKFNMNAIAYTQDPHTLSSYINQIKRWYSGGWQNFRKHFGIMKYKPNAALFLSLNYIEGLIFSLLFFVLPVINIYLFLYFFAFYFFIGAVIGLYAAIRRRRIDLFLYSPVSSMLRIMHAWLFLEQFFMEIILKKNNMVWFHPERRMSSTQ